MSTNKPWGRIGAWAAEAEAAEAEEREAAAAAAAAGPAADAASFPSLQDAASARPKKKKGTAMSLSEFHSAASSSASYESRGLTPDEMMRLPTGPRQRSEEELGRGGLGGGFRSYGLGGRRDDMGGSARRPYGGFEDESMRRGAPPSRASDLEQMPSRADEVDNWASMKKPFAPPPPLESGRHDRYEALGGRGGASRADEVDNWAAGKKAALPSSRYSGFGSGFRDSVPSDSDRWVRGSGGQLPLNGDRERPRLTLNPPKGDAGAPSEPVKLTRPSPFGVARPREEVLAEKGVDWRRMEAEIDIKKTSRPTSSHSSRPSSAQSSRTQSPTRQIGVAEVVVKTRPKVNPFGDAKPREVVLQEQGKDWKKIDFELEHRGVDRPETEEEKILKEEINRLNELLAKGTETNQNGEPVQLSAEDIENLQERRDDMERELEHLARELDDKVRFGQKATGDRRPGSGSGRVSVFSDRPSSQSGMSEDARSVEFTERPRSRGGVGDIWTRAVDDRRSFQLGTGGGFLGNRDIDRSRSRERW